MSKAFSRLQKMYKLALSRWIYFHLRSTIFFLALLWARSPIAPARVQYRVHICSPTSAVINQLARHVLNVNLHSSRVDLSFYGARQNTTSCDVTSTHRVTVTSFRSISMPAGFRRHLVGKTLIMFVAVKSPKYALLIS